MALNDTDVTKPAGSDSFRLENPAAIPALRYQIENGPMVTLGHALKEPTMGPLAYNSSALKDGKVITWAFDEETLKNSQIARRMEGMEASTSSVGDYGSFGFNSLVENIQQLRKSGYQFTDHDRAVIKAIENDLLQRAHPSNIELVEQISREMGNPPAPGFTRLDNMDKYSRHKEEFLSKLPQEKRDLFANPASPPAPLPKGNELWWYGYTPEQLKDLDKWRADVYKFEHSLSPEELEEWNKIREEGKDAGVTFYTGGSVLVTPVIDPEILRTFTQPKTEPQSAPARDFTVEMHTGKGPIPVNADVLAAQKLMKELKGLEPEKLKGLDLGKYGANHDGLDGKFGNMTHKSVEAMEKYLGIDPPTGKITDELVEKMKAKVEALRPSVRPELERTVAPVPQPGGPEILLRKWPFLEGNPAELKIARAEYQDKMGQFYGKLSPELKSLFTDPLSPFGGTDENGRPHVLGILLESYMDANAAHAANLERFEKELSKPGNEALKEEWEKLKGLNAGAHFQRPDDGIKGAPQAPYRVERERLASPLHDPYRYRDPTPRERELLRNPPKLGIERTEPVQTTRLDTTKGRSADDAFATLDAASEKYNKREAERPALAEAAKQEMLGQMKQSGVSALVQHRAATAFDNAAGIKLLKIENLQNIAKQMSGGNEEAIVRVETANARFKADPVIASQQGVAEIAGLQKPHLQELEQQLEGGKVDVFGLQGSSDEIRAMVQDAGMQVGPGGIENGAMVTADSRPGQGIESPALATSNNSKFTV